MKPKGNTAMSALNIIHTTLPVGATAPFKIIHLSDTHLTYADLRDGKPYIKCKRILWRIEIEQQPEHDSELP